MNVNNRATNESGGGGTSNNYYTTGATLGGDNVLTGSTQATTWTANLSALAGTTTPGGSDTQVQYNNGGAFAGNSGFTYNGTNVTMTSNLLLGSNLVHNGDTDTYLGFETDNIRFYAGNTNTMNIKAAGVGIGTNTPLNSARATITDTTRQLVLAYDGSNYFNFAADGNYLNITANSTNKSIVSLRDNGNFYFNGDNIIFETASQKYFQLKGTNVLGFGSGRDFSMSASGNVFYMTSGSEDPSSTPILGIKQDGSVGIGTNAPEKTLHVKSDGTSGVKIQTSDASSYAQLQFTSPNTGYSLINFGDGDASSPGYIQYTHSSDLMLLKATKTIELKGASAAGYINFSTDNTERMRITGAGDVGIGTTSPDTILDIHKDSTSPLVITTQNATAGTSSYSGLNFKSQTAVGWLLSHSDTRTVTRYGVTVAGYNELLSTAGNGILFGTNHSAPIIIGTNDTERMRILSGGNVGIGETSPAEKLDVAGNIRAEVSSKSIVIDPYFVVSGDNQYSMISGSAGLALYPNDSYTDFWVHSASRSVRFRAVASDGSFDAGSFLEVFPDSIGATGDANANIRASSGDLSLYTVGDNNLVLNSHHSLNMFFDNEYQIYSAADGNPRFMMRDATVASMEFDNSQNIKFKNATSTKMTLDTANGRLGIGTTPSYPLHINGTATQEVRVQSSDSGAYSRIQLRSATDGYAQFNMGDSGADAAGGLDYTHSSDTLAIRAANAVQLSITDNLVTLGDGVVLAPHSSDDFTIDSPNDIVLDYAGNNLVFKSAGTTFGKINNNNAYWDFDGNAGSSYLRFIPWNGGAGTTAYTYWGDTTHDQVITIQGAGGGGANETTLANSYFRQKDSAGNIDTYIQAGGNSYFVNPLGIGLSTTPGETLHVAGTGRFTGKVAFGGSTLPTTTGISVVDTIQIQEKSSAPTHVDTWGVLWVKNDDPTNLYFTDDDGNDIALTNNGSAAGGGGGTFGGSISSGKLAIGTGTDTIGNFVDALTEVDSIYIGTNPSSTTNDAGNNVALGIGALDDITTADDNTAIGYRSLYTLNTGVNNVAVGSKAGSGVTTGGQNTVIGKEAGISVGTHSHNTYVGYNAAIYHSGDNNVGIGSNALRTGSNDYNVAVGMSAMTKVSGGAGGVAIGYQSGYHPTGNYNTWVGYNAGFGTAAGSAELNVGIGREALMNINDGDKNTAIGYQAGKDLSDGIENTLGGYLAGQNINTGNYNTVFGSYALEAGTTASRNVAIGYSAMLEFVEGDTRNTAVGMYAMHRTESGSHNVAMGYEAMKGANSSYDSDYNVAIGSSTMYSNAGGDSNTIVGYAAGYGITTGGDNVHIGYQAGYTQSTATASTLVGYKAGTNNTASSIVALGKNAGFSNSSGIQNTFVGFSAGHSNETGGYNVYLGYQSGYGLTTSNNVVVGNNALANGLNTSDSVVVMGHEAAYNGGGGSIVAIGKQTLYRPRGNYNIAIGEEAMKGNSSVTTAQNNVAIGRQALLSVSSGEENVAIGYLSMYDNTSGLRNTAIGAYAATGSTTGQDNVAVGHSALQENQEGDDMVAIGRYAAYNTNPTAGTGDSVAIGSSAAFTNTTGVQNVVIGRKAAYSGTSASNLVVIGREAGEKISTGSSNVVIGGRAGYNITKGAENVMIGQNAGYNYAGTTSGVYGAFGVFVGHAAGYAVTGGHSYGSVMAIGHQPMYNATGAKKTIAIGQSAVVSGTNVEETVALGNGAGAYANATGSVYVGNKAGFRPSGNYNVAVGYQALSGASAGSSAQLNVAMGYQSAISITSGYSNTSIGYQTSYSMTTGAGNTHLGVQAGFSGSTHNNTTFIGNSAGLKNTSNDNVAIGSEAYLSGSSATQIVAIGRNAGKGITTGQGIIAIGPNAAQENEDGTHNVAIGWQALMGASGKADKNIGIGTSALLDITNGTSNVGVGYQALQNITTGDYNIAMGDNALRLINTQTSNVGIGHSAGYDNNQSDNVFVGSLAGFSSESSGSTLVGFQAGYYPHGNYNTFIGYKAGKGDNSGVHTALQNVGVGSEALTSITSGQENVLVGDQAGYSITTGDYNVGLGSDALRSVTTGHGNIGIGRLAGSILADHSYTVAIGYGAGQDAVTQSSVLIGHSAGYNNNGGDNNVFIGKSAGINVTTGGSNVIIGPSAGPSSTSTTSNELYINNSQSNTPLIKGDFSAPSLTVNGDLGVTGSLSVTGSTLAVQQTMKTDLGAASASETLSDSYSRYLATADNTTIPTLTLTCPSNPQVGDEYFIVARCLYQSTVPGGSLIQITPNTGQTINQAVAAGSNIALNSLSGGSPPAGHASLETHKTAHLICIDANIWVLTISDVGPTS